jgi:hypothetical protein
VLECAIKAKIADKLRRHDIPDPKVIETALIHDLEKLINHLGLKSRLDQELGTNPNFKANWEEVTGVDGWSEESRYKELMTSSKARKLINAIKDTPHGVLAWIEAN